jgi:hypothetical protein
MANRLKTSFLIRTYTAFRPGFYSIEKVASAIDAPRYFPKPARFDGR